MILLKQLPMVGIGSAAKRFTVKVEGISLPSGYSSQPFTINHNLNTDIVFVRVRGGDVDSESFGESCNRYECANYLQGVGWAGYYYSTNGLNSIIITFERPQGNYFGHVIFDRVVDIYGIEK